jgi:hypothetical protein
VLALGSHGILYAAPTPEGCTAQYHSPTAPDCRSRASAATVRHVYRHSRLYSTGVPMLALLQVDCQARRLLLDAGGRVLHHVCYISYGSPIFKAVQQKRCTALYFQRVHPVIAYSPSLRGGFAYQSMGFDWHTPPGQQPPTTKLATTIRATMHIVIRFIVFLLIFGDSGFV